MKVALYASSPQHTPVQTVCKSSIVGEILRFQCIWTLIGNLVCAARPEHQRLHWIQGHAQACEAMRQLGDDDNAKQVPRHSPFSSSAFILSLSSSVSMDNNIIEC